MDLVSDRGDLIIYECGNWTIRELQVKLELIFRFVKNGSGLIYQENINGWQSMVTRSDTNWN